VGEVDFHSFTSLDLQTLQHRNVTESVPNHTYGIGTYNGHFVKLILREIKVQKPT